MTAPVQAPATSGARSARRPLLPVPAALGRPVVGALVLLAVYVGLGLLTDPGGTLGTDTGGKVATLEVMAREGRFDPDLGYWAADADPDGDLHPFYYTEHLGDRYVNVTTLPLLVVAWPLYAAGGYHAAVLPVAASAVAAALAARALAARTGGDGTSAFWVVGLASPVAVYALDLWEHAPGLALMAWGVVAVAELVEREGRWWCAGLAGLAFGAAATMRTEALVYGAVVVAAGLVAARPTRSLAHLAGAGVAALVGVTVGPALHLLAEQGLYGEALRTTRAGGALSRGGVDLGGRLEEGLLTTFGVYPGADPVPAIVLGAAVVALVVVAVELGSRRHRAAVPLVCLAGALLLVGAFGAGLGFVPGLLIASPVAAAGLLALAHGPSRWLGVAAVGALPVVWAFQYGGGAGPQWGGRYQLVSGLVLAVLGVRVLAERAPVVGRWLVALALCTTTCGVAWTVQRSHQVGDAFDELSTLSDELVISRSPFFLREGGVAVLDQRWLSISTSDELRRAVDLAEAAGRDHIVVLTVGDDPPASIRGWRATSQDEIPLFSDEPIRLQTYVLDP